MIDSNFSTSSCTLDLHLVTLQLFPLEEEHIFLWVWVGDLLWPVEYGVCVWRESGRV
jgi:hypothetical protein